MNQVDLMDAPLDCWRAWRLGQYFQSSFSGKKGSVALLWEAAVIRECHLPLPSGICYRSAIIGWYVPTSATQHKNVFNFFFEQKVALA